MRFLCKNLDDTNKFAQKIAEFLKIGNVIDLRGEMGAGKTTFVSFLVKALKIDDIVTSPSFSLVNIYEGDIKLYHLDLYRLEDEIELFDLDFEKYFYPDDAITIIEWGSRGSEFLPEDRIIIDIIKIDDNTREFVIDNKNLGVDL